MFYNLLSLFFGLCAWVIPFLFFGKRHRVSGVFASLACALICLLLQILGFRHEVITGDFAAIEDTIAPLSMICMAHSIITLLLNGLLLKTK